MRKRLLLMLLVIGLMSSSELFAEWNETPDYWKCFNRVSGDWTFGIAPYGCDASAFGSDEHIRRNYLPVLFVQSRPYASERNRYMQETFSMLQAAADHYIRSRKSNVSDSERRAFQHATLAIAHQESYWSHYRQARQDNRFKMMRGDFGHGHGLMQVDDRAHYTAARQGKGWELISNIFYSLDEYYTAWRGAGNKWCIQQYGNTWRNRAREAYSQYNGGPSASCRWTNPNHRWARNDIGFAQKYDGKAWEAYVANQQQASTINVVCLANGGSHCPPGGGPDTSDWYQKLIQTHDGQACVFDGEQLHCVADLRHSACLVSVGQFNSNNVLRLDEADTAGIRQKRYDPHTLCFDNVAGLIRVGGFVTTLKQNKLRQTPNGEYIRDIEPGAQLQVEDIVVFDNQALKRFYRVTLDGQSGYLWGGSQTDYKEWLTPSELRPDNYPIPSVNDWVEVQVDRLNLRRTPGGEIATVLTQGTPLLVKGLVTQGNENQVYLHVLHNQRSGYIYAGYQLPNSTLAYWVKPTAPNNDAQAAFCPDGSQYDATLMVCRNQRDSFGPFSRAMLERCSAWGGGAACEATFAVSINGVATQLPRWSTDWFYAIRENRACPLGTWRDLSYGNHCVEKNSQGIITDVYGPFDSTMVSRCLTSGGGQACYFNRWSAAGFRAWRHSN